MGFGDENKGTPGEELAQLVGLGAFREGTVIYQGLMRDGRTIGFDKRPKIYGAIRSRVREASITTKGYLDSTATIVHTTTDEEIIDTTRRECPLQELLPVETAKGKVNSFDILSARGAAVFVAEDVAAQTPASDTYLTGTKTNKIITMWGGWTDFAMTAMAAQYPSRDAAALEIKNKTWSLIEGWENEIINGSTTLGATATGFIGLRAEAYTSETATSLNNNLTGAAIIDTDINTLVREMTALNVPPNLILTDLATWQSIEEMMMGSGQFVIPTDEIAWGLKILKWRTPNGDVPILAHKFMPTTATARELLAINTQFTAQRLLLDATMEKLAKTSLQQPFVIKKFGCVIDKTQKIAQTYNNNAWPATTTGTSKIGRIYNIA